MRMVAALGLLNNPQPALSMHQNHHNVTTAFDAAFGDGPMTLDTVFGGPGPSQSVDSYIGWGGLDREEVLSSVLMPMGT